MGKLGKREIIILGIMAIAILYGGYEFFIAGKKKPPSVAPSQKTAELSTVVSDLTASLGKDTTTSHSALVFNRAENVWAQDPFLENKTFREYAKLKAAMKGEMGKLEFVYSGYLEMGKKRMAVINGVEYKEGEALEMPGYVLSSVSPTRIVIVNRGAGTSLNVQIQD